MSPPKDGRNLSKVETLGMINIVAHFGKAKWTFAIIGD